MKKIYGDISGGLGNLLFDCSHLYTVSKKYDIPVEYHLRATKVFKHDETRGTQLDEYVKNKYNRIFRNFDIKLEDITHNQNYFETSIQTFCKTPDKFLKEPNYPYIILKDCWPSFEDLDLIEIQELFAIDNVTKNELDKKFHEILSLDNKVSIHVRRGDYLKIKAVNLLDDTDYYKDAMELLPKNSNFIVFSDCINDCKQVFNGDNFFFIEGTTSLQDLYLQTYCPTNICANSTFSYWAAYLNRNDKQKVIMPNCCNYNFIKNGVEIIRI